MQGKFVSYLRVSTAKQGLGIDAQRAAVAAYLNGGAWEVLGEFEEKESGKRDDNRPQLQAALKLCRLTGAKLVIAKLDRLSRNSAFLNNLLEAGVPFVCCDMPDADPLMIRIMAAVAQRERELNSVRTRAGLQVIREKLQRGEEHVSKAGRTVARLGGFRGSVPRPEASAAVRSAKAQAFAEDVGGYVVKRRSEGASLATIAADLDALKIKTPRGATWTATTVKRVLDRLGDGGRG